MLLRVSISILTVLVAALPAGAADRESVFRGKRSAEINCGPCHAVGKADTSPNEAAPPLRELWERPVFATLREELGGPVFARHAVMPDFEPSREQAADLMNYVESIQDR